MFDFFGYHCTSPAVTGVIGILDTLTWVWIAYLLFRVHYLKRDLAMQSAPARPQNAPRIDDRGGGRTWDITPSSSLEQRRQRPS